MTLRRKLLTAVLVVVGVGAAALAILMSHDAPCGPSVPPASDATRMKGVQARCYGSPEVLEFGDIEKPVPADDEVLVKVHAASVNPLDWHVMRGQPYVMRLDNGFGRPKSPRMGVDFAGTVEAVGRNVTRFKPGDTVFGGRSGALAEYVNVRESRAVALMPDRLSFQQAAAIPIAATTALQALRDKGRLQAGETVLINGASGGVGTFAVQIAKALGAEVTGVCSTRNVPLVRSIGADHVVDYTRENFTQGAQRYDMIVDMVGNHALLDLRRALEPDGRLVIVGGESGAWLAPLDRLLKAAILSPFVSQEMERLFANLTQEDLAALGELAQAGKMTPVIDRRYPLADAAEAIEYLETGRARGKVIVVVQRETPTTRP
jgi:NADPH:quinone reductase-like Zn-dependent oxidoreductase